MGIFALALVIAQVMACGEGVFNGDFEHAWRSLQKLNVARSFYCIAGKVPDDAVNRLGAKAESIFTS
jgi:hypothetical protein